MKQILVLGSTGSIGRQTLQVVENCPNRFQIVALSAHRQAELAAEQAIRYRAKYLLLTDPAAAPLAKQKLKGGQVELIVGMTSITQFLRDQPYELAVQAITGAAGLPFSVEVLRRGKTLALANKESLVIAGEILGEIAKTHSATVLPIDSEHSAIFQCLQSGIPSRVRKIYLTGSGGPFRDRSLDSFDRITPQEALKHPNWSMGDRITVGSATMMNKAFEVIEAHHLFGLAPEQIQVVVHPQSIIHSMVEFVDGSLLAQMGIPDMRIPIHYALHYPERGESSLQGFDFQKFRQLTLEQPDPNRYPAIELGYEVIRKGGVAGAIVNASDEVATQMFLDGAIRFPEIVRTVTQVLKSHSPVTKPSYKQILEADRWARQETRKLLPVSS